MPETQTQIVDAAQGDSTVTSTLLVASQNEVSSISGKGYMATEPKKLQLKELIPKKKAQMKHQKLLLLL